MFMFKNKIILILFLTVIVNKVYSFTQRNNTYGRQMRPNAFLDILPTRLKITNRFHRFTQSC